MIVRRWFDEQHHQIDLLEWPSKGCDLNPIESVWGFLVNAWEPEEERTRQQLLQHALREWNILQGKPHIIENLVKSMPSRLQEVIEKGGGWTHY